MIADRSHPYLVKLPLTLFADRGTGGRTSFDLDLRIAEGAGS